MEINALLNAKGNQWRKKKAVMIKMGIQRSPLLMSKTMKNHVQRECAAVTKKENSRSINVMNRLYAQMVVANKRSMEKFS